MQCWISFAQSYLPTVLYATLTAIAGFLGVQLKKAYDRLTADETKRKVVQTCVAAVEQLYQDCSGEQKKQKALESIAEMLDARGIAVTQLELEMLLESAVAAIKNASQTA